VYTGFSISLGATSKAPYIILADFFAQWAMAVQPKLWPINKIVDGSYDTMVLSIFSTQSLHSGASHSC
jgi:hypothetical protein